MLLANRKGSNRADAMAKRDDSRKTVVPGGNAVILTTAESMRLFSNPPSHLFQLLKLYENLC